VLGFSGSLTATRAAVPELGAVTVGLGRAAIAGLMAIVYLWLTRAERPKGRDWASLAVVAVGVVLGFPLLAAVATQSLPSSHAGIVVGLAPMATAVFAVLRGGERPSRAFWGASIIGALAVVAFGAVRSRGRLSAPDGLLLIGVLLVGAGYAEGGKLSRAMGGANVICWSLVLALPVSAMATALGLTVHPIAQPPSLFALAGLAYLSVVSMFGAFFAWYRGLALAGITRASQIQLAQGPLGALWAHVVLGESLTPSLVGTSLVVVACAVVATRSRLSVSTSHEPRPSLSQVERGKTATLVPSSGRVDM
jgi:drug/metabolite transporter (DMT)-like permease